MLTTRSSPNPAQRRRRTDGQRPRPRTTARPPAVPKKAPTRTPPGRDELIGFVKGIHDPALSYAVTLAIVHHKRKSGELDIFASNMLLNQKALAEGITIEEHTRNLENIEAVCA